MRYLLEGSKTPASIAQLLDDVERSPEELRNAWALRERIGEVARAAFGPPRFMPFAMPGWE